MKFLCSIFITVLLIVLLSTKSYSQFTRDRNVKDGWRNKTTSFGPEFTFSLLSYYATGISLNYQKGMLERHKKPRKYIYEIGPGFDFIFYPDILYNINVKTVVRFGVPFSFGFQYNYITDFDEIVRHSAELKAGFVNYAAFVHERFFWKILLGYEYMIQSTKPVETLTPIKLQLSIGVSI